MDDDDDALEEGGRESNRSKAARMKVIADLVKALVEMKPAQLDKMPLPDDVMDEVRACQGFTKNARARQLRRIGSLLRTIDTDPIAAAVRELETGRGERSRREQSYERWRARLLAEGDPALAAFLREQPQADAQALRTLVRVAAREPETARGKRASRELLRAIRALGEAVVDREPNAAPNDA